MDVQEWPNTKKQKGEKRKTQDVTSEMYIDTDAYRDKPQRNVKYEEWDGSREV